MGRDHAGVGDFYGAFDAQDIFESIPKDALEIKIFKADHTAYSKKLNKVVMMRDVEDHTKEDFVNWTKSEAFRLAHKNAGQHQNLYLGHPNFEGFEKVI